FVAAGRPPDDPANVARRPMVKICGVTDTAGVAAAVASGADAIGLNLVPGTPRCLTLDEAATLARFARQAGGRHRPAAVAGPAAAAGARGGAGIRIIDPNGVQWSGPEAVGILGSVVRRTWKVIHVPADEPSDLVAASRTAIAAGRAWLDGGAERLFVDTAGGP